MAKGKRKKPMILKILLILVLLGVISFCGLLAFVCIREGQVPKTAAELPEDDRPANQSRHHSATFPCMS